MIGMEVGLPVREDNFSLLQSFHQTASEPGVNREASCGKGIGA